MKYNRIILNCRISEVPLIGRMYISNLQRDIDLLFAKYKYYTSENTKMQLDKLILVEGLISPVTVLESKKTVTKRIKTTMEEIRPHLKDLENFINHTKKLSLPLESFRLHEIREMIKIHNIDGVIQCIKDTMVFVDENLAALKLTGLTDEERQYYEDVIAKLAADKVLQAAKVSTRRVLSQDNINTINDFASDMLLGLSDGFAVFAKNPALQKDYVFVHLRGQVRLLHKPAKGKKDPLGAVSGKALDKATHLPKAGVQVRALNTDFSTTTDANGEYMIDGLVAGTYALMFKATGCKDLLAEKVVIKAGKDTDFDVEMEVL